MASKGTGGRDGTEKEKYIIMGAAGMQMLSGGYQRVCAAIRDATRTATILRMRQITADHRRDFITQTSCDAQDGTFTSSTCSSATTTKQKCA